MKRKLLDVVAGGQGLPQLVISLWSIFADRRRDRRNQQRRQAREDDNRTDPSASFSLRSLHHFSCFLIIEIYSEISSSKERIDVAKVGQGYQRSELLVGFVIYRRWCCWLYQPEQS